MNIALPPISGGTSVTENSYAFLGAVAGSTKIICILVEKF